MPRTRKQKIGDMGEATAYMNPFILGRRGSRYGPNHPGADGFWIDDKGIRHEWDSKATEKPYRVDPPLSKRQRERKKKIESAGGTYTKIVKHIPTSMLGEQENLRDMLKGMRGKK